MLKIHGNALSLFSEVAWPHAKKYFSTSIMAAFASIPAPLRSHSLSPPRQLPLRRQLRYIIRVCFAANLRCAAFAAYVANAAFAAGPPGRIAPPFAIASQHVWVRRQPPLSPLRNQDRSQQAGAASPQACASLPPRPTPPLLRRTSAMRPPSRRPPASPFHLTRIPPMTFIVPFIVNAPPTTFSQTDP